MQQFKILALLFLCLVAFAQKAAAQATLSVQRTIQKSTGVAIDDGDYAITFRLYDQASGGTANKPGFGQPTAGGPSVLNTAHC